MMELLLIICIVFGILPIILFFKIWGMTNDIKKIRSMTNLNNRLAFFGKLPPKCSHFQSGIYQVRGIYEDKIFCARDDNDENVVEFDVNEVNFMAD